MRLRPILGYLVPLLLTLSSPAEPIKGISSRWVRLDSSHFSMLTDDQVKGQQVLARFEQMRAVFAQLLMKTRVNMPEPIEIIAFKTSEEYEKVLLRAQAKLWEQAFFFPATTAFILC